MLADDDDGATQFWSNFGQTVVGPAAVALVVVVPAVALVVVVLVVVLVVALAVAPAEEARSAGTATVPATPPAAVGKVSTGAPAETPEEEVETKVATTIAAQPEGSSTVLVLNLRRRRASTGRTPAPTLSKSPRHEGRRCAVGEEACALLQGSRTWRSTCKKIRLGG
jgi:hypothetical protein